VPNLRNRVYDFARGVLNLGFIYHQEGLASDSYQLFITSWFL